MIWYGRMVWYSSLVNVNKSCTDIHTASLYLPISRIRRKFVWSDVNIRRDKITMRRRRRSIAADMLIRGCNTERSFIRSARLAVPPAGIQATRHVPWVSAPAVVTLYDCGHSRPARVLSTIKKQNMLTAEITTRKRTRKIVIAALCSPWMHMDCGLYYLAVGARMQSNLHK